MMETAGVDRLSVINAAIDIVRRGGTISLSGVYGGMADPMPMLTMFDKQINLRMGQANVKRWIDDIMPLLEDEDPLGVDGFATHRLPLDEAPAGLRDVPEEAGRRDQDPAAALAAHGRAVEHVAVRGDDAQPRDARVEAHAQRAVGAVVGEREPGGRRRRRRSARARPAPITYWTVPPRPAGSAGGRGRAR